MCDVDVCRFSIISDQCWVCGRAAMGRFGPGTRRGYVGMGADKGNPALSRRGGARSSGHERKWDVPGLRIRSLLQSENVKVVLLLAWRFEPMLYWRTEAHFGVRVLRV